MFQRSPSFDSGLYSILRLPIAHALSFLLISTRLVAAISRSVIIDDTYGDAATGALPVYAPSASWIQGKPCAFDDSECFVNPDPKQAMNGTWHDSQGDSADTPPRTIDLSFEGNSIIVYCIISEVDRVEIAVANMTFELDGDIVGTFFHDPDGSMDGAGNYRTKYEVAVYQNTSAPQGSHTLRVSSVGYSRMLFDYAEYTTEVELESSSAPAPQISGLNAPADDGGSHATGASARPKIALILGVVGGALALLAIGLLILLLLRRRRRSGGKRAHRIDSLKHERQFYGKDDVDARNYASSVTSFSEYERPPTPFFPYMDSSRTPMSSSRLQQDPDQQSVAPSPTDSIPLMVFPVPPSHIVQPVPRIVVTGAETTLVGPDNSMARYARQEVAEQEAKLTRRMREVEAALAEKYQAPAPFSSDPTPRTSAPIRTGSVRSDKSGSEDALREQLEELKAEIDRMRMVQQQMALELRDATEPPPMYQ
ncbi:hypothetical protein C8Q80DRAFT_1099664 [Daedaleopsis nitida]|nr:hypothetical protein C8Q80DRAFT_1099664 [Daedaleopsis nitida]